ncbi:TolC family outer membrane protein [Neptunomonas sp. XY-337]|uniref:TolC family outer membrane protein n=1 Tax=Neptunomonas sp. XY-337 TaxID=2561897 RepID=UPI0010A9C658|nr:TolC family outer membrane protein [Neptunomonas sp. XY-337]
MKLISHAIRVALVAGLCSSAAAQAGSLEEIYRKALNNDPQLKAAQANYRADKEALPQAKANLLPVVNAEAKTGYVDGENDSYNTNGYTVSLVQPVFSAAKWQTYQQGKVLDEQAQLRLDQAQQALILRTIESYLNVLRAQSNLDTAQAQVRAIKRRLDQVNAQFDVGLIAITDVHEAQASYDNARVSQIEAEGALDNSYEALERLIGEPVDNLDQLAADYPIQALSPAEPQPWLKKALQDNLSLRVATSNVEVARRSAKIAKAGHLPTVDLNASHGETNALNDVETSQIGLTLSVPLYQGGAISSRSRQNYALLDASMQTQEDTLRAVRQTTRSLLRDLKTNVLSVAARQQSIVSSEAALKATSEGFNVGTRNVVDVLQAEQALYAAQRDYASARFDYVLNLFTFKQQIGTLNPDDIYALDEWLIAN